MAPARPVLAFLLVLLCFATAAAAQERLRVGTKLAPPFVLRDEEGNLVITSYSIHYTKLYES